MANNYIWKEWSSGSTTSAGTDNSSYYDDTWTTWSSTSTCDSTASSTGSTEGVVWRKWTSDTTAEHVTYTYDARGTIWSRWNETYKEVEYQPLKVYSPPLIPEKTTEQKRAERVQLELQIIWMRHRSDLIQKEREEAEDRALELLSDIIGEDQMLLYKETGRLVVHGEKHDWLLRRGRTILKLDEKEARDFCVHLRDRHSYPETDNIISLALRLKQDEAEVERIANRNSILSHEYVGEGVKAKRIDYEKIIKLRESKEDLAVSLMAASY